EVESEAGPGAGGGVEAQIVVAGAQVEIRRPSDRRGADGDGVVAGSREYAEVAADLGAVGDADDIVVGRPREGDVTLDVGARAERELIAEVGVDRAGEADVPAHLGVDRQLIRVEALPEVAVEEDVPRAGGVVADVAVEGVVVGPVAGEDEGAAADLAARI